MSAALQADEISVRFDHVLIVDRASLALRPGELTVMIGPNGAGKTTLLRALAGLIPAKGRIKLAGRSFDALSLRERARRIAYLPQGNEFHWPMSVASIVALGRYPHADPFGGTSEADRVAVRRALAATATEAFADRPVTTLSGGERARVALARALATEAGVLLVDEPIVSLDPRHQLVVMGLLRDAAKGGAAVLAIVHELTLAARFADRVIVMERGRIVADGSPTEALIPELIEAVFGVEAVAVDIGGNKVPVALHPR
jgi:iron complex transport system ATP-binding protein